MCAVAHICVCMCILSNTQSHIVIHVLQACPDCTIMLKWISVKQLLPIYYLVFDVVNKQFYMKEFLLLKLLW